MSSTDDEADDSQFIFRDENTILGKKVPSTEKPIVDSPKEIRHDSSMKYSTIDNNLTMKAQTHSQVNGKLADVSFKAIRDEVHHIEAAMKYSAIDNNWLIKTQTHSQVTQKIAGVPWEAKLDRRGERIRIPITDKTPSRMLPESVEKERAGSSQKQPERLNSSALMDGAMHTRSHPSQKLHEDEDVVRGRPQVIPLELESNSVRGDSRRKANNIRSEDDDEVFYDRNVSARPTRHHNLYNNIHHSHFPSSHYTNPHGARRFGVSGFDDYRPSYKLVHDPEYYRRKREDLSFNELRGSIKMWSKYGKVISSDVARFEKENKERQELLARCVQNRPYSSFKFSTDRYLPLSNRTNLPARAHGPLYSQPLNESFDDFRNLRRRAPAHEVFESMSSVETVREEPIVRQRTLSAPATRPAKVQKKAPFFGSTNKTNHVSFSIPANSQHLLNILKNRHPIFFTLAKELIEKNPKCENLAEEFLSRLETRAELLKKRLQREESLRNAMDDRRLKLRNQIEHTRRDLKVYNNVIDKLREELDLHHSDTEQHLAPPKTRPSSQNQAHPKELNGIRILHRVFSNF